MRLFLAIEIDHPVRRTACRLTARLERELDRSGAGRRVRWVAPANLHVTLKFLGETDATVGDQIREAMAGPLAMAAFEIHLAGLGMFPAVGAPRVVWVGLAGGTDRAVELHRAVEARLTGLGVPPDGRHYHPHLTLGRLGGTPPRSADHLRRTIASADADLGRCRVARVALVESRLLPGGPVYEPLVYASLREEDGPIAVPRVVKE